MGQAKRKAELESSRKRRFKHLMRLISRYNDYEIEGFARRRGL